MDENDNIAKKYFNWMLSSNFISSCYTYNGYDIEFTKDGVEIISIKYINGRGDRSSYRMVKSRIIEKIRQESLNLILGDKND